MLFSTSVFIRSIVLSLCLCSPIVPPAVKGMPSPLSKDPMKLSTHAHSTHVQARRAGEMSPEPIILYLQTTAQNADNLVNHGGNLKEVYQTPFGDYRRLFTAYVEVSEERPGEYAVVEFSLMPANNIRIVDVRKKGLWTKFSWPQCLQDVSKGRLPGVLPGFKPDVYLAGPVALLYGDKAAEPPVLTYVTHSTGGTFKEAWMKLRTGTLCVLVTA